MAGTGRGLSRKVSIPYSSGHLFRLRIKKRYKATAERSQSLIHQVIYSVAPAVGFPQRPADLSQSLIHQVIYSVGFIKSAFRIIHPGLNPLFIRSSIPFRKRAGHLRPALSAVSIPYSSGHLFRSSAFLMNWRNAPRPVSIPYSSGHLFRYKQGDTLYLVDDSLNPLFIRSSIPFGACGLLDSDI